MKLKKRPARKATRAQAPAAAAGPVPEAGYWRPTQTMNGRVLQYAWTCPGCGKTEFVLCGEGRKMDILSRKNEWCPCMGQQGRRIRDDRECRVCTGTGDLPPAPDGRPVNKCPECLGSGVRKCQPAEA